MQNYLLSGVANVLMTRNVLSWILVVLIISSTPKGTAYDLAQTYIVDKVRTSIIV